MRENLIKEEELRTQLAEAIELEQLATDAPPKSQGKAPKGAKNQVKSSKDIQ